MIHKFKLNRLYIYISLFSLIIVLVSFFSSAFTSTPLSIILSIVSALVSSFVFYNLLQRQINIDLSFFNLGITKICERDLSFRFSDIDSTFINPLFASNLNKMVKCFGEDLSILRKSSSLLNKDINNLLDASEKINQGLQNTMVFSVHNKELLSQSESFFDNLEKNIVSLKSISEDNSEKLGALIKSISKECDSIDSYKDLYKNINHSISTLNNCSCEFLDFRKCVDVFSDNISLLNRQISDILTEANIVHLNTRIDSSRSGPENESFFKLLEVTDLLTQRLSRLSQDNEVVFRDLRDKLDEYTTIFSENFNSLEPCLDNSTNAMNLLKKISNEYSSLYNTLINVQSYYSLIVTGLDEISNNSFEIIGRLNRSRSELIVFFSAIESMSETFNSLLSCTEQVKNRNGLLIGILDKYETH